MPDRGYQPSSIRVILNQKVRIADTYQGHQGMLTCAKWELSVEFLPERFCAGRGSEMIVETIDGQKGVLGLRCYGQKGAVIAGAVPRSVNGVCSEVRP